MKRQAGFTLIELVMVIVILGILSAFALPRFADLGSDARTASLNAALGAVKSASAIAHADALVNNQLASTGSITLEGQAIAMAFGYPTASSTLGIADAAQIEADYTLTTSTATPPVTTVTVPGATTAATCVFTYTQAASATVPAIISTATTGGC
jgi:MSHA pilin protein MshA